MPVNARFSDEHYTYDEIDEMQRGYNVGDNEPEPTWYEQMFLDYGLIYLLSVIISLYFYRLIELYETNLPDSAELYPYDV